MKSVNYSTYAIQTIRRYLENIEQEINGVRLNKDIEPLHRMRIATRRLRSALRVFKDFFRIPELEKWRRKIRLLGRALGQARELDVQIRFLQALETAIESTAYRVHVKKIKKLLVKRRYEAQRSIISVLNTLEKNKIFQNIRTYLTSTQATHCYDNETILIRRLNNLIKKRLLDFLNYAPYVHDPQKAYEHHEMRIAAKHLRYTLEILKPLYITKLNRFYCCAKNFQDVLGDLREFDVWLWTLPSLKREAKIKDSRGIAVLKEKFSVLRKQTYKKFLKLWIKTEDNKIWNELMRTI